MNQSFGVINQGVNRCYENQQKYGENKMKKSEHEEQAYNTGQQPSILLVLKQSVRKRPTFEELFSLEQQKRNLWLLLALKQEQIEKLSKKIHQIETKSKTYQQKLTQRQKIIKTLKQRQATHQKELKRSSQIRENIVQQFNLLKSICKQNNQRIVQHKNNLQQTDTCNFLLESQRQENVLLKKQIKQLLKNNQNLKFQLNSVLRELGQIKINVIQKFHIGTGLSNQMQKQNIDLNKITDLSFIANEKKRQMGSFRTKKPKFQEQIIQCKFSTNRKCRKSMNHQQNKYLRNEDEAKPNVYHKNQNIQKSYFAAQYASQSNTKNHRNSFGKSVKQQKQAKFQQKTKSKSKIGSDFPKRQLTANIVEGVSERKVLRQLPAR